MHTIYSDGTGTFDDLIRAASQEGLDFVFVTDHNLLVRDKEEGYRKRVLTLVGEEVHDEGRNPPGNHLLCLGVHHEVANHAPDPQELIDAVNAQGALAFLAHPIEEFTSLLPDHYDWYDWDVTNYHGVELWNYMSNFRGHATSKWKALALGFFPHWFTIGPLPAMLKKWDELTQQRPVVAIGGTDVHAQTYNLGLIRRRFLPYDHCARALNTHILTTEAFRGPLNPDRIDPQDETIMHDRQLVLDALAAGHCWVGYDLVHPTRGFRFAAWQAPSTQVPTPDDEPQAIMGDSLPRPSDGHVTHFSVQTPASGQIRLLHNGRVVAQADGTSLTHASPEPGVYRVEVWKRRWLKHRGWIFSNPIYVR
jgi:hypothetical protein